MKLLRNLLLTLLMAALLVGTVLAVPSASVNEDAEDRYMEQVFGE